MAYDKNKIFEQAKEAIERHKLFFMDEVPDFLPCSRSTFYDFFPDGSDELDTLKRCISINKTQIKTSMRSKWYKSDAPALQIALMKLISTDEEAHRLNGSKQEVKSNTTINTEGNDKKTYLTMLNDDDLRGLVELQRKCRTGEA